MQVDGSVCHPPTTAKEKTGTAGLALRPLGRPSPHVWLTAHRLRRQDQGMPPLECLHHRSGQALLGPCQGSSLLQVKHGCWTKTYGEGEWWQWVWDGSWWTICVCCSIKFILIPALSHGYDQVSIKLNPVSYSWRLRELGLKSRLAWLQPLCFSLHNTRLPHRALSAITSGIRRVFSLLLDPSEYSPLYWATLRWPGLSEPTGARADRGHAKPMIAYFSNLNYIGWVPRTDALLDDPKWLAWLRAYWVLASRKPRCKLVLLDSRSLVMLNKSHRDVVIRSALMSEQSSLSSWHLYFHSCLSIPTGNI